MRPGGSGLSPEVRSTDATLRASAVPRAVVGGRRARAPERSGRLSGRVRWRPGRARGGLPAPARAPFVDGDAVVALLPGAGRTRCDGCRVDCVADVLRR